MPRNLSTSVLVFRGGNCQVLGSQQTHLTLYNLLFLLHKVVRVSGIRSMCGCTVRSFQMSLHSSLWNQPGTLEHGVTSKRSDMRMNWSALIHWDLHVRTWIRVRIRPQYKFNLRLQPQTSIWRAAVIASAANTIIRYYHIVIFSFLGSLTLNIPITAFTITVIKSLYLASWI